MDVEAQMLIKELMNSDYVRDIIGRHVEENLGVFLRALQSGHIEAALEWDNDEFSRDVVWHNHDND